MKPNWKKVVCGLLLGCLFASGRVLAQETPGKLDVPPEQQQRMELMKSKGTEASLTILPVRLGGKPFDRVTEVVGLLLEQQGLKNIELGKTVFEPANKTDLDAWPVRSGEFVKHPITTEYVLYAEINGIPNGSGRASRDRCRQGGCSCLDRSPDAAG